MPRGAAPFRLTAGVPRAVPDAEPRNPREPMRIRLLAAGTLVVAAGCAHPDAALWPPRPGETKHRVVVSTDYWHTMIGLHPEGVHGPLEEWGFANRRYYYDGDQGCLGTVRALFVPGPAVLEVRRTEAPHAVTTDQPPGRIWEFDLTDEGYARLREAMAFDLADDEPFSHKDGADWYRARSPYSAFRHCHTWAACVLRKAGLPVRPTFAPFKWAFEMQLERAREIGEQAGSGAPALPMAPE
jgi:hypothetical protein